MNGAGVTAPGPVLGFVGLGTMGLPMATNLAARSGCGVLCHDRDSEAMARALAQGLQCTVTLDELANGCDVVLLCLASAAATSAVAQQLLACWRHSPQRIRTVIDTGTTALSLTLELAELARAAGHRYADAPVARMPAAAVAGTLSMMVGGDAATLALIEPYLRCMATDLTHCGAVGSGQVVKILHNTVLFEAVHALAEALAVARRLGVDGDLLFRAIELGSADSQAVRVQGRQALLPGVFPHARFSSNYALKDVELALELALLAGIPMGAADATGAILRKTVAAGYGDQYYPSLYKVLEEPQPSEAQHGTIPESSHPQ